MRLRSVLLALSVLGFSGSPTVAQPPGYPQALPAPLPLFPASNWWNVDISSAPADTAATTDFLEFVPPTTGVHPDFGGVVDPGDPGNPEVYGMVYFTVPGNQARVPVTFDIASQSDTGWPGVPSGYPIPSAAITQPRWIEGGYPGNQDQGSDQHMLIVDRDNRLVYETWQTRWDSGQSRWEAGSGAIFALDSNDRRPDTWTSADAAGLSILPGLVLYDEAFGSQPIRHAFRVTIQNTQNAYVYPASHRACNSPCPTTSSLPMGARLRLKSNVNPVIPGDATAAEVAAIGRIAQAMKTYGLIVADNGGNLFVQGAFDSRWNNDVLNPALDSLEAEDFDVVQLGWKPPAFAGTGPTSFHTLTPCRVLDTRNPPGILGGPALWPNKSRAIPMGGICGIPLTARAVSINVTTVNAPATGTLSLYPENVAAPVNSTSVSFRTGTTRANNAVVALSSEGKAVLGVRTATTAAVHFIVDVNGYFQ